MECIYLQNENNMDEIALEGVQGNLTPKEVYDLARGFHAYIVRKYNKKHVCIAIGQEVSLKEDSLFCSILDGLLFDGTEIYDCGLVSLNPLFNEIKWDGAILLTVNNSIRFFDKDGNLTVPDMNTIIQYVNSENFEHGHNGTCTKWHCKK